MNVFIDILLLQCYNITLITSFKVKKEKKRKKKVKETNFKRIFSIRLYIFTVRYINVVIQKERLNNSVIKVKSLVLQEEYND